MAANPLTAFRSSGYIERVEKERAERNRASVASYA
jgi:hypothetical protein